MVIRKLRQKLKFEQHQHQL